MHRRFLHGPAGDAIVIGSGFGERRLPYGSRAGAQVTIIEQGPRILYQPQHPGPSISSSTADLGDEQTSINLARTWGGASPGTR